MLVTLNVARRQVQVGDDLLGWNGRPYFHVTRVDRARARGYLVFTGYRLDVKPSRLETAGGNDTGLVTVQREVRS